MFKSVPNLQTKEQYAYTTLRDAIIRCELAPGEKLVIDHLSTEMGLSQIPIRTALQRLQSEGLVIINPHAGAIVAPLPSEKIAEVFALLESLERTAFTIAAQNRTDADLIDLANILDQMDAVLSNPDPSDWLVLNCAFHRRIATITAMPLLIDFTARTLDEWMRISHHYFANITSTRLPQTQAEHRQIIDLLRARDTDALESLAAAHNRDANRSYQALLNKTES
ncbi:MAG TPA: GntR family transcriptional regulator [Longilinea sp.]|nr:GntR family transcriptional regulator [Longilinea sp.]